ncbi:cilia- and flagella-associated protein 69-like isoform X2 [Poeciliopsis prolifica]|uniref:cilia- and flagella-associated protein 69-like isoform X2 n=1 Tax=Poeciliopsis prolifica TaxID=188132 RepID=UPI002412F5DA|nr:cilia- and flagella-associated protein 69-like isoform X2 [Poeciliopsis prolifica]
MDVGQSASREISGVSQSASSWTASVQESIPRSLDLMKILYLLRDPLTTNLTGRHLFVLRKLLKRNKSGFLLRELADIAKIIDICAVKVIEEPKYAPFLCEALLISRIPFLKEKASDDLIYPQDAINFLSCLGRLLKIPNPEIQEHVVETVQSFFSSEASKDLPGGGCTISPLYRLQLVERSDLPKLLVESLAALQNQPFFKLQLLETLQLLCSFSDLNCRSMVDAGAAATVCLHMNGPGPPARVLACSTEILWMLLESSGRDDAVAQLCSLDCVVSLKEAFSSVLALTSQGFDLQLRNCLLVFTTLIAENPNCPLIESLFAKQLLGYITLPEVEVSSTQKLTHSKEDLKMKKLLLNLLILLSRHVAATQLFREELVMVSLLRFVDPPQKEPVLPQSAILSEQEELQLQALETLASIAPVMLQDYMDCQGNTHLLLLLDWCCDDRNRRKLQMQRCIRVLRAVTSLGEKSVNQDLSDQGAIHQLLGIIVQLEAVCDEGDVVTIEMMSNIQLILSVLCETDLHRKELFGAEGVEMVVHFLKKGSENFYSGLGHNKLLICTIDCVWSVQPNRVDSGHSYSSGGFQPPTLGRKGLTQLIFPRTKKVVHRRLLLHRRPVSAEERRRPAAGLAPLQPQVCSRHHPLHPAGPVQQPQHPAAGPGLEGRRGPDGPRSPAAALEGGGGGAGRSAGQKRRNCRSGEAASDPFPEREQHPVVSSRHAVRRRAGDNGEPAREDLPPDVQPGFPGSSWPVGGRSCDSGHRHQIPGLQGLRGLERDQGRTESGRREAGHL